MKLLSTDRQPSIPVKAEMIINLECPEFKNPLRVMKLIAFFLLAAFMQVSASGSAQTITFSGKNVSVEKVFRAIKKQTNYSVVYSADLLDNSKPVNVSVSNASVEEFLRQALNGQPLKYSIENTTIFISQKPNTAAVAVSSSPPIEVTGRVTNARGEPLAGASVTLKRTGKGDIADANGEFTLSNVNAGELLQVSYIGYDIATIKIVNNTTAVVVPPTIRPDNSITVVSSSDRQLSITIVLSPATNELDKVQVQAYGTTTRRFNTGNIAKVTGEEISRQPVINPLSALQGRVPGVIVSDFNGIPGSAVKIEIRGRSSLDLTLSQNTPLFIIDGVPFAPGNNAVSQLTSAANNPRSVSEGGLSPFTSLNPQDIASIEILKDADATAIYGSRGANGVVLITTKKGADSRTTFNIAILQGFSKVTRTMDMLNTTQYLAMRKEAFANDNVVPTSANAPDLLVWDTTRYTDWKKALIGGTARMTNIQASLSGGTSLTHFLLGVGYNQQTTVFPGDMAYRRVSVNFNLNHISRDKKFTFSLSANFAADHNNLSVSDLTRFLILPPDFPALFDSANRLKFREKNIAFSPHENPLSYLNRNYKMNKQNLMANLQVAYQITPDLTIRSSMGYNLFNTVENSIRPLTAIDPQTNTLASSNFANANANSWIIEPQAEYKKKIGASQITVLLGGSWQEQQNANSSILASGYTNDLLLQSVAAAGSISTVNNNSQYNYVAVFGRLTYRWQDKYVANFTARRDGSSRFGPEKRFANFGAAGGAWLFTNEPWMKGQKVLSFGKLRSSYGITGNDQIGNYLFLDTWTPSNSPYLGSAGLTPTRLFNPDYSWEINKKLEVGLDLGFLKDKLLLSAAYFRNRSSNQLVYYTLPVQTGFNNVIRNLPALVQNSGLELTLSAKPIKSKSLSWESAINLSIIRNKLLSFPDLKSSSYASIYVEGQSLHVIYGYKFLGVDPATGIYQFGDVDKDGLLSKPNDLQPLGNTDPLYYGGFQNSFTYKCLRLDVFFEFRKQIGRNYLADQSSEVPGYIYNQPVAVLNRWQEPGDIAPVQRVVSKAGQPAYTAVAVSLINSDGIYSDASFIRLKSLSLSYSLPSHWLAKLHGSNGNVFVQCQNLLTITGYKGADPEIQSMYMLPPLRTMTAGIQFTF